MASITFRIDDELASRLAFVTRVEGCSTSDLLRDALEEHLGAVASDQHFKQKAKEYHREQEDLYRQLVGEPAGR